MDSRDPLKSSERELIQGQGIKPSSIFPTSTTEYINSLAHYYRGEIGRMASWRDRLDRTTNWAVAGTAAMLSVALSTPDSHHGTLLFAMLLVFLLLFIESRRYRFFHLYRTRVRLLEKHYYAHIFAPCEQVDPSAWTGQLGADLRSPFFTITLNQAMARRLRRNYCWIFLILLLAWLVKLNMTLPPSDEEVAFIDVFKEFLRNAAIGYLPGWLIISTVALLYGGMIYVMVRYRKLPGEFGPDKALV